MSVNGGTVTCGLLSSIGETGNGTAVLSNNAFWGSTTSFRVGRAAAGTMFVLSGSDVITPGAFTIGGSTGGIGALTVDGAGSSVSAATLELASVAATSGQLAIANGGLLTTTRANIGRGAAATLSLSGAGSRWTNNGDIYLGGNAGASGGAATVTISGGTLSAGLIKLWNANTRINYNGGTISASTLELAGGGDLVYSAGANKVLRLPVVTIASASGSELDLADNDLIIDYAPADPNPKSTIVQYVVSARNGGAWNGGGITSSAARTHVQHATTLGVLDGAEYASIYGPNPLFAGQTVDASTVLVKYTWYGDTDFSGKVDGADYARIDTAFNNQVSQGNIGGWLNGDSDFNNKIDGADYALMDSAFNSQSGTLRPPGSVVPEPALAANALVLGIAVAR
jgi:T5SS/PEP-CTERM-associated repeat protein